VTNHDARSMAGRCLSRAWTGNGMFLVTPARSRGVERRQSQDRLGGSGRNLRWWKSLETLKHANSDAFVCENVSPYIEVARLGDLSDYAALT
jgi:hypothetical protein